MLADSLFAVSSAAAVLVCWPSSRWQKLVLGALAGLTRAALLVAVGGLGLAVWSPELSGNPLLVPVRSVSAYTGLDSVGTGLLCAVALAALTLPVLAGLDFLRVLCGLIHQLPHNPDPAVSPPTRTPLVTTATPVPQPGCARRRLGDLLN